MSHERIERLRHELFDYQEIEQLKERIAALEEEKNALTALNVQNLQENAKLEAERDELRASFRLVSDTLDTLKAENARQQRDYGDAEASIETFTARIEELEAENMRLTAPVSDEEWAKTYWPTMGGMRDFLNEFIAARASAEVK